MNKLWLIGALALALVIGIAVYIGSGDDGQPAAVDATDAETEQGIEDADAAADESNDEEAQIVVEESAAEPEEDEQVIMLAQAATPTPAPSFRFQENKHYTRMVPSQPTMGGADKIEVAEFFWYGCPHCFDFEPAINAWASEAPASVRFVRIPVSWNQIHELHARLFYTAEVLGRNGALKDPVGFHNAVFQEFHRRNNRLTSVDSIRRLFERYGVSADAFDRTWKSFEVDQKLRVAADLARRYSISGVPAIVVNGKYKTGGAQAGGYDAVTDVIDELVVRESQR